MSGDHATGREVIRQMLPSESVSRMENVKTGDGFGWEFPSLALENVYQVESPGSGSAGSKRHLAR
jgi:hypothetical protein